MLAMNRDEQVSRPRALAPRRQWTGTRASLYPCETGGGTWIGVSEVGLSLALINWYAKPQRDRALCVSRGIIIPHLLAAENLAEVAAMFADLPLLRIERASVLSGSLMASGTSSGSTWRRMARKATPASTPASW